MPDEIIKELWEIKDAIAREHGYDVDSLAAHLRAREAPAAGRIDDLHAVGRTAGPGEPAGAPPSGR